MGKVLAVTDFIERGFSGKKLTAETVLEMGKSGQITVYLNKAALSPLAFKAQWATVDLEAGRATRGDWLPVESRYLPLAYQTLHQMTVSGRILRGDTFETDTLCLKPSFFDPEVADESRGSKDCYRAALLFAYRDGVLVSFCVRLSDLVVDESEIESTEKITSLPKHNQRMRIFEAWAEAVALQLQTERVDPLKLPVFKTTIHQILKDKSPMFHPGFEELWKAQKVLSGQNGLKRGGESHPAIAIMEKTPLPNCGG